MTSIDSVHQFVHPVGIGLTRVAGGSRRSYDLICRDSRRSSLPCWFRRGSLVPMRAIAWPTSRKEVATVEALTGLLLRDRSPDLTRWAYTCKTAMGSSTPRSSGSRWRSPQNCFQMVHVLSAACWVEDTIFHQSLAKTDRLL